jgi:PAS domain S-box-containing protein
MDITDRRRSEEANARLAAIVSSSPDAIISFAAADKRILTWNRGAEALFGYTEAEAIGGPVNLLVSPAHVTGPENRTGVFDRTMAKGQVQLDTIRRRKDGSLVDVSVSATRMTDAAGRVLGVSAIFRDITERKRWEEHQQLLINELNHRVKNTLATVQSIASQTLRNAQTKEEARRTVEERLFALSRAHNVLTQENWEGAGLKEIVTQAMAPYRTEREDRLHVEGPDVRLSPSPALALAMALQELATNAVKYGALSNTSGEIRIGWRLEDREGARRLHLTWRESGGPPVTAPTRRGFGTRLIERSLAQDLQGEVSITFAPTGLVCTVDAPLQGSP